MNIVWTKLVYFIVTKPKCFFFFKYNKLINSSKEDKFFQMQKGFVNEEYAADYAE